MLIRNVFIAAAVMAMSAPLFAADVDFDRGIDLNALKSSMTDKVPPPPVPNGYSTFRYTTDCHTFRLYPAHFDVITDTIRLNSHEYINECRYVYVQDPPPPPPSNNHGGNNGHHNGNNAGPKPNNGHNPKPGTHNPPKPGHKSADAVSVEEDSASRGHKLVCRERPGATFHHNVRLNVQNRNLYPWEKEEVTVCAEHDRSYVSHVNSPYKYSVSEKYEYGYHSDKTFEMIPRNRLPSEPDADGLSITDFRYDSGLFTLKVADKWHSYYEEKGERVRIIVELYRDRFLVDKNLGKKTFEFDTDYDYELVFSKDDFNDKKVIAEEEAMMDQAATRKKTEYYVKWGFQRIGRVSTNKYMKKGSSDKITID